MPPSQSPKVELTCCLWRTVPLQKVSFMLLGRVLQWDNNDNNVEISGWCQSVTCGRGGGWRVLDRLIWREVPGLLYRGQRTPGFCHKTRKWRRSRRWEDYRTVRSAQPPQQWVPLSSQDPPHQSRHTATYHHHYHIIIILIRKHVVLEFIKKDCSLHPISGKYQIPVWICISVGQYTQSYNPFVLHSLHFDDNFFPLSIKDDGQSDMEGREDRDVVYIRCVCVKLCQNFISLS